MRATESCSGPGAPSPRVAASSASGQARRGRGVSLHHLRRGRRERSGPAGAPAVPGRRRRCHVAVSLAGHLVLHPAHRTGPTPGGPVPAADHGAVRRSWRRSSDRSSIASGTAGGGRSGSPSAAARFPVLGAGRRAGQLPGLFPAALGCLVASKAFTVTQASAVPRLLPDGFTLVNANSRISMAKVGGAAVGGGLAVALVPGSGRSGHCGSASPSSSAPPCWPSCCRPGSTPRRANATSAGCSPLPPGPSVEPDHGSGPAPVPEPEAERAARAALRDGRSAD